MSRARKIALIVAGSLGTLLVVLAIAAVIAVQTPWFRNFVREKLISAVEDATGGKVEVQSFDFDLRHLRAVVRHFVIHGLEPPAAAPLFRANLVEVDLGLKSPSNGFAGIHYLLVDAPQANVIAFSDGRTNIPAPKTKSAGNSSGLQTVVNLAIGRFTLRNGSLMFADRKSSFNATGENLRAQLGYNSVHPGYTGEIDISPLNLKSAGNAPVDVNVRLPLALEGDRITVDNARLSTPASLVQISASVNHLAAPHISSQVNARVALEEIKRAAGLAIPLDTRRGPSQLLADISATSEASGITVQNINVRLGQSTITASGPLETGSRPGNLQFNAAIAVGEIGRLLRVAARPDGVIRIGGNAGLGAAGNYRVQANIIGRNLAASQGTTRITGVTLDSTITADPQQIALGGLRIGVLGGDLTGSGAVANMQAFHFSGKLNQFRLREIGALLKPGSLGYSGVISGDVQADGNTKNTSDLVARAALSIQPTSGGVPVSGRITVDYNGRAGTVNLARSFIALPNTRLDLAGSLGQQVQIRLVTRNTGDFRPVASLPLTFRNGGHAEVNATVTGNISAPRIAAQLVASNFAAEGRPFTGLTAALTANPSGATVTNAALTHDRLQAEVNASIGLRNWKPEDSEPVRADATIHDADLADILALAGSDIPAQGALTADAHFNGTIGDPRGTATLSITNGSIRGQHFDSLTTRAVVSAGAVEVPAFQWIAGPARIDANATYQHPLHNLKQGTLQAHIASNQVQLAQFQPLLPDRPGLGGTASVNADGTATIRPGNDIQVANLTANLVVRGLQMQGQTYGDATVEAHTNGSALNYTVGSNFGGSHIRVSGQSLLTGGHATTATAQISNLRIDRVLAVAGRGDLPVRGTLTASAQVSGTLSAPTATAKLEITNGSAYQQTFNLLEASINYSDQRIDLPQFHLEDGGNSIEASGSFTHPPNDLQQGQVRFQVRSNPLQLARFAVLTKAEPGLAGTLQLSADGIGTLRRGALPLFSSLNAGLSAKNLALRGSPLGNAEFTAQTRGTQVAFSLTSNLARANVRGTGTLGLANAYPLSAHLDFSNLTYSGIEAATGSATQPPIDASVDGQVTVYGPANNIDALRGSLQLTRLEAHSTTTATNARQAPRAQFELHNNGPVVVELDRSLVTVRSAHIAGPFTDLSLAGSASLANTHAMNVRANGNVKLEALEAFDPGIFSSGAVILNASVTGTAAKPVVTGRLQLQDASFNMTNVPNGISNANGVVAFSGSQAAIQNITAESGGGKITLSGFVGYGGPQMEFRVQARAERVHVLYPASITTQIGAQLSLTGTTASSLLSGTVRISEVSLQSHSDFGSMLNSAAAPPSAPSVSTGFMAGLKFDVRILTTSGVLFRTPLTQNLQADANLTLRGTPDNPGMLGRVTVTEGQVVFFGNKYSVDQGTISFFDPAQIQPILNVDLSTTVQGVDVTLSVSGPADKMKLSYRSDPPMQFSDIVSLLASGSPPAGDPVLAARQTPPPQQNLEQSGASMLLGEAVASPVAGRLQRLFGVTKLSINPQIVGTSNTPGATLTLQQQINNSITFTYIQDVTQSNPQIIRIEWAFDPRWSAIASRDVNGEVNVDLFYKKRFR